MEFKFEIKDTGITAKIQLEVEQESPSDHSLFFAELTRLASNYFCHNGTKDYCVYLTSCGFDKIGAIKSVRAATDMGLKEAKEMVESMPCVLAKDLTQARANQMIGALKAGGYVIAKAMPTKMLSML